MLSGIYFLVCHLYDALGCWSYTDILWNTRIVLLDLLTDI